jgi:Tfp pilus assembly protein PilX
MSVKTKVRGAATLPTVILMSAIVIEIAVAGVVIANALNNTAYSQRLAERALAAAKAGTDDAFMRIVRYKNCPGASGCPCTASTPCSIQIDTNTTASVTMSNNGAGVITVNSVGTAFTRQKKLQMIVGVDSNTGLVSLQSLQEIAY